MAAAALRAGKAVFLEKPLGLSREEIDEVWAAGRADRRLVIGFNRPLAPLAEQLIGQVQAAEGPTQVIYRVNAPVGTDHWLNDPLQGGGRILGEACLMFDFANALCGMPQRVLAAALLPRPVFRPSSASVTIQYTNGSLARPLRRCRLARRCRRADRGRLRAGRSWVLDDFRTLTIFDGGGSSTESGGRTRAMRGSSRARSQRAAANHPTSPGSKPRTRRRAWPWRHSSRSRQEVRSRSSSRRRRAKTGRNTNLY
jgi:predicted dehydrogenase